MVPVNTEQRWPQSVKGLLESLISLVAVVVCAYIPKKYNNIVRGQLHLAAKGLQLKDGPVDVAGIVNHKSPVP